MGKFFVWTIPPKILNTLRYASAILNKTFKQIGKILGKIENFLEYSKYHWILTNFEDIAA